MKKKIIVANWKMNNAFDEADIWLENFLKKFSENKMALANVEAVVCPPVFLIDYIDSQLLDNSFAGLEKIMQEQNKKIDDFSEEELMDVVSAERPFLLGAQDCHYENSGSFTGDISAEMLKKTGADYVILGHSERRENHFETDDVVARKATAAMTQNLTPIICVGENKESRDSQRHLEFVYKQLLLSLPKEVKFSRLIIAYEPIWSIGTGVVPTTEQIREMAKLIRKIATEKMKDLADEVFVLYGGSVNAENAQEILAIENVDGLLVGKASLDADGFVKICLA